ncbi:putative methionine import ATP-binding protein MetN [Candidatus Hepatincolaceae symbiont of Richtersius coronifer]
MIKIINVCKKFAVNNILDNINLEINPQDIFGIIGYSGAGKSTLLRLINSLETLSSGNIIIDDIDISTLSKKQLRVQRSKIGMIFQNFNLLSSKTVYQNIAFPLEILGIKKNLIKEKVRTLLNLVKLEGKENAYPKELSGGQKQRVGIARALANSPKLLLCDEATSALDPINTRAILSLLKDIQQQTGVTLVLITHEMDVIRQICNKVAVLDKGSIIEQGYVQEVFHYPKNPITKDFVIKGYDHNRFEDISPIISKIKGGKFIKLYLNDSSVHKSIISELALKFHIQINIVEAFINNLPETSGQITAHIQAPEEVWENIVTFTKEKNLQIEVIENEL